MDLSIPAACTPRWLSLLHTRRRPWASMMLGMSSAIIIFREDWPRDSFTATEASLRSIIRVQNLPLRTASTIIGKSSVWRRTLHAISIIYTLLALSRFSLLIHWGLPGVLELWQVSTDSVRPSAHLAS